MNDAVFLDALVLAATRHGHFIAVKKEVIIVKIPSLIAFSDATEHKLSGKEICGPPLKTSEI